LSQPYPRAAALRTSVRVGTLHEEDLVAARGTLEFVDEYVGPSQIDLDVGLAVHAVRWHEAPPGIDDAHTPADLW